PCRPASAGGSRVPSRAGRSPRARPGSRQCRDRLTGAFRLLQRRRAGRITWLVRGIAGGTGRGRRLSLGTTLLGRGSPGGRSAARSICSRPVLLSRSRPAWPVRQGRSSGGSGVIWSAGLPPGSHHPRVARGGCRRQLSPSTPSQTDTISDVPRQGQRAGWRGRNRRAVGEGRDGGELPVTALFPDAL